MKTDNQTHYIAMGGLHGCLPSHCEVYQTYDQAVDSMIDMYSLSKARARELKRNGYLELSLHRDGNEYIEITDCDCNNPADHSDSGELNWD